MFYYTSYLDIVSYPLVALCGMIVMLLDSSVSFVFLLMMYLCLFLPYALTNEYIACISIFIFKCCKNICLSTNNKIIVIFFWS